MPVQSWGHVQYWENSSTVVTPVSQKGGYPTWQAAPLFLVLGFGFGGAQPIVSRWAGLIGWAFRLFRIIVRWDPARRRALGRAVTALDDVRYAHALRAVRMTAIEPGFSGPAAWKGLAHKLHAKHAWAENQWRHLQACDHADTMLRADGSTISNTDRAFMVELAYQSYAQHAVGSSKA